MVKNTLYHLKKMKTPILLLPQSRWMKKLRLKPMLPLIWYHHLRPCFLLKGVGDEENEEDVDIDGSTMPLIHDDFWDIAHRNSPITTPLTQVPPSTAHTEEVHTGSEGHQTSLQTIIEEIPAAIAEEIKQPELIVAAP
jgi:hypothetical protein